MLRFQSPLIPTEVSVIARDDRIVVRLPNREVIRGLMKKTPEEYCINILQLPDAVLESDPLRRFLETHFALIGCPDLDVLGDIHSDVTEAVPIVSGDVPVRFDNFHMFEEFPLVGAGIWDRFDPDFSLDETPHSMMSLLCQMWDDKRARNWFLGVLRLGDEERRETASRLQEVNADHRARVCKILGRLRDAAIPGLEIPGSPDEFLFSGGLTRSLADRHSIPKRYDEIWLQQAISEVEDRKDFPLLRFLVEVRLQLPPDRMLIDLLRLLFEQAKAAALFHWSEVTKVLLTFATARVLDENLLYCGYRPKRNLCLSEGLLGFSSGVDGDAGVDFESLRNAELHHADVLNVVGFSGGPVVSFRCLKDLEAVVVGAFQSVHHSKLVGTRLHQFCRQLTPLRGATRRSIGTSRLLKMIRGRISS